MYRFYGWEKADILPANPEYEKVGSPREMYDYMKGIWSVDSCAPRLRVKWSEDNITVGQCSITAFLAQDVYGGEVYGVPLEDGNFHCYNVVGDCVFDLTSEQFGDRVLSYENNPVQERSVHFAKTEKKERYEMIKDALKKRLE